jgi:hypothetical protein
MNDKNFARDLRRRQKETWLELAGSYLRDSNNEFLKNFGAYLEGGYRDSEQTDGVFNKLPWATNQQIVLKEMLDFEAFRLPSMQAKGFALIGKANFDKLEFIKKYFEVRGLSEFAGDDTAGCYAVVNCSDIKGYNGLIKTLVENQDVSYVVFDNCDSLLKHDDALRTFKQLAEDFPGITIITKNDDSVNFKTDSSFIFLGEENTLHIVVEKQALKGNGASAYNHLNAFVHYIHVYDFDKGERYLGNNVTPIYN